MKALVVIDMQNDFITGPLGNPETVAVVSKVADKINEFKKTEPDGVIFVTIDSHKENYPDTQEGKNLPVTHCIVETKGWEIADEVGKALFVDGGGDVTVVVKDTFGSMALPSVIPDDVEEIQIIGICTDICVISNAMILKASFPEVPITVFSSCCAGVTPESHTNALNAMKMCQIIIKE